MNLRAIGRGGLGLIVAALGATTLAGFASAPEPALPEPADAGGPPTMRLVTAEQYRNSIHDIFGDDIDLGGAYFPTLPRKAGLLALGATEVSMTPGDLDVFRRTAEAVAARVVDPAHRETILPCRPRAADKPDPACAQTAVARIGRLLFRRPLDASEVQVFSALADTSAEKRGGFYRGLASALSGMLASPKFLYVTETIEPDPTQPGKARLDAYSKASRLSLLLWDASPDDALLAAAQAGELNTQVGVKRQVERMLASPRAEEGVRAFFEDLLQLQSFETVTKDSEIYPAFTAAASETMHEQALRLILDHLMVRQEDYRTLFTTNQTFVNRALGLLYRTRVPVQAASDQWLPYAADPQTQAGLLTSISFLTSHSHPGRSSPTQRGRAIREIFLCQRIPDPPPTVDFTKFESMTGKLTARSRLEAHRKDPVCAGCHRLTDPVGLAFENYDGAGQYRSTENGQPIDTRDTFDGHPFDGVFQLGQFVAQHPALTPCLIRRLFAYGVGRDPGPQERAWLDWTNKRFAAEGYKFPALLRDIATSNAFFAVQAQAPGAAAPATSTKE